MTYSDISTSEVTTLWCYTHTRLTAVYPGLPRWASTRKVKPIWILLKQETVSSSGISWAICKSAPRSRQITAPALHHSVFYRPDALPATQPTAWKHWRHLCAIHIHLLLLIPVTNQSWYWKCTNSCFFVILLQSSSLMALVLIWHEVWLPCEMYPYLFIYLLSCWHCLLSLYYYVFLAFCQHQGCR